MSVALLRHRPQRDFVVASRIEDFSWSSGFESLRGAPIPVPRTAMRPALDLASLCQREAAPSRRGAGEGPITKMPFLFFLMTVIPTEAEGPRIFPDNPLTE